MRALLRTTAGTMLRASYSLSASTVAQPVFSPPTQPQSNWARKRGPRASASSIACTHSLGECGASIRYVIAVHSLRVWVAGVRSPPPGVQERDRWNCGLHLVERLDLGGTELVDRSYARLVAHNGRDHIPGLGFAARVHGGPANVLNGHAAPVELRQELGASRQHFVQCLQALLFAVRRLDVVRHVPSSSSRSTEHRSLLEERCGAPGAKSNRNTA